jgi:hypothetical protein
MNNKNKIVYLGYQLARIVIQLMLSLLFNIYIYIYYEL